MAIARLHAPILWQTAHILRPLIRTVYGVCPSRSMSTNGASCLDTTGSVVQSERAARSQNGCIPEGSPASVLLSHDTLIVERQIEMLNVFMGYEQANRYVIFNQRAHPVGYIAEQGGNSLISGISRQLFHTHRAFTADVLDLQGQLVLQLQRPFSWINSRLLVNSIDGSNGGVKNVGSVIQNWHLFRRKYGLFINNGQEYTQFSQIDEPFLSWNFALKNEDNKMLGSVSRNFMGLPREMFTDTGSYVLRFSSPTAADGNVENNQFLQTSEGCKEDICPREMSLEERAVMLGSAVTIDFDYFSRTRHGASVGFAVPFMHSSSMGPTSTHVPPTEDTDAQKILRDDDGSQTKQSSRSSFDDGQTFTHSDSPFMSDEEVETSNDFWDIFDNDGFGTDD
ncbi:phospholipid scramblase [Schizosaccharomyces japonicus yFS275]|uniref:Phospholipid scramblase n=1 Tax=Schizosaccharomyces japonicus (strain yFS275 / FY16936) TaxID=402676 RepID=B6JY10_SCHJY|nr:phospholipid scramblase [Schizosaccharomyces japonicus yFS275]EEB06428.2 phospholipid scramblase [Schizosaccharomyces japonicus yFS275]